MSSGSDDDGTGELVFGRRTLAALLAPEVTEGRELLDGWRLTGIDRSSYGATRGSALELCLVFKKHAPARTAIIEVAQRNEDRPAFVRTEHFNVVHILQGRAADPSAEKLCAFVCAILAERDRPGRIIFPDPSASSEVEPTKPAVATSADDEKAAVNLFIDADCGQSCAFCSLKDVRPPMSDDDAGVFVSARADLEEHRARGVRRLWLNGYDPLAHTRILELLAHATSLGYAEARIFTPGTRLSDAAFCRSVIEAAPDDITFDVPLYSTASREHDDLVGSPGAHAQVTAALENIRSLVDPGRVSISMVCMRQNLHRLGDVAAFAREFGARFAAHTPYPSPESATERYYDVVPRQEEMAEAVVAVVRRAGRLVWIKGLLPCVVFREIGADGPATRWWTARLETDPLLPGVGNLDTDVQHPERAGGRDTFATPTLRCPHVSACVFATVCPRGVLDAYAQRHGLLELRPVSLRELQEAD